MNDLQEQIAEKLLKEILDSKTQYRSNLIDEYAKFVDAVNTATYTKQMESKGAL